MDIVKQILLPLVLAFIMFTMGLGLTTNDFKNVGKFPKAFFLGLLLQMLALPAIAFGIASVWQMNAEISSAWLVGLIILAASPGGVTSNLFTYMAKGDTALSISLTVIISLLSVFSIPFIVNLGLQSFAGAETATRLPIGKTIFGVFIITSLPVMIGMTIRHFNLLRAQKLEPMLRTTSSILFVLVVIAAVSRQWSLLVSALDTVAPVVLSLNLITMFVAFFISKLFQLKRAQKDAIVFECGLQNGTLAVMIAVTLLDNETMMLPAAVYSILMFFTGGAYLAFAKKQS